ncbi:hypothetical protein [Bradyrhizobium sp. SRS-191]|uniref:hypothetical protein n=1 Tax=Bradyrhizobium sp. SRS-191 TaxID=2962606 RepID=UPI00211DAF8E|nr:hypothetical protein [Bradyrhizobium sp. SRS-191]
MVDTYTIYLVNKSADTQLFWCFLERPQELVADPGVYANSSASLAIASNQPGTHFFAIPVQYKVGAGASNNAVGLDVVVTSNVINDASIKDQWQADYKTIPPQQGPTMKLLGNQAPANSISITSGEFDKAKNENGGWFSNQSFGIQTGAGFIGMSWSPKPQQKRTLTPKLSFYIAIGDYGSNTLADWNTVSTNSIQVNVPIDFQYANATVTYDASGNWSKTPGKPPQLLIAENLDWLRSNEHNQLLALAYLSDSNGQVDYLKSVSWNSSAFTDAEFTYLSGTITVTTALTAAFAFFVLANTTFTINSIVGGTTVNFTYSGSQNAQVIKDMFIAGAQLFFGGRSGQV